MTLEKKQEIFDNLKKNIKVLTAEKSAPRKETKAKDAPRVKKSAPKRRKFNNNAK